MGWVRGQTQFPSHTVVRGALLVMSRMLCFRMSTPCWLQQQHARRGNAAARRNAGRAGSRGPPAGGGAQGEGEEEEWFTGLEQFKPLCHMLHRGHAMQAWFAQSLVSGRHFVLKKYDKSEHS